MTKQDIKKIRTVHLNERGQIVIPEDIRKDFGIEGTATLVIIEENNELILKKESDVLETIENNDKFWKLMSGEAMKKVWDKEDEIWDKIYKNLSPKFSRYRVRKLFPL